MAQTKLVPKAAHLFNIVMDELEVVHHTDEQKYHILRYLTNMLESKEEEIYKSINHEPTSKSSSVR